MRKKRASIEKFPGREITNGTTAQVESVRKCNGKDNI